MFITAYANSRDPLIINTDHILYFYDGLCDDSYSSQIVFSNGKRLKLRGQQATSFKKDFYAMIRQNEPQVVAIKTPERLDNPRTMEVDCGECGKPYHKPIYDLDLQVGDKVLYKSHLGTGCEKYPVTITDTTYKADGLYFGWCLDVVWEKMLDNVRVDTRSYEFVRV